MIITDTHIYFYGGIYSNWYPASFTDHMAQLTFANTEQAFMWRKALVFGDKEAQAKILAQTDPKEVKALGREIKGFDATKWSGVAQTHMLAVNMLKFHQNADLGKQLKDTGDRILVEASPYDAIWGIKLSVEDAAAGKPWQGTNLLGVALMEVRKLLR